MYNLSSTSSLTPKSRKPMTASRLERRVLAYVARYLTSSKRLEQFIERLLMRWRDGGGAIEVSEQEIADLIQKCIQRAYIDDQYFAELRLARWYRAGYSQQLMQQKLRAEQLDDAAVQAAFEAFRAPHSDHPEQLDFEAAMHYARKRRIGPHRVKDRAFWRERDIAKMGRRGFSCTVAYAVIDHDSAEDSYN